MTQIFKTLLMAGALGAAAQAASAACIAEYKAKQDNPLRLEHGTIEVQAPCTIEDATPQVASELEARGWTLLKVLSVSEP